MNSGLLIRAIAAALLMFGAFPVKAETFMGRKIEIFDGRSEKSSAAPLVIAMHGFLGTSRNMRRKTGFNAAAKRHSFVVAYPNGKRRKWNDGRSPENMVDDVGYLSAFIEAMIASGIASRPKIYLTGHSNGGGMAMRMACERPDLIDGIAVVATKSPRNFQCRDGRPVPALFIHGTQDPIAPHGGRPDSSRLGGALSGRDTIQLWKSRNRCSANTQSRTIDRKADGTLARVFRFNRCAASLSYVLIEGHGHDWPRPGNKSTRLQGAASQEVDATALVWQFFSRQH